MTNALFEPAELIRASYLAHGQSAFIGAWQVRNFHGYQQSREGGAGRWRFYVSGFGRVFDGAHVECSVLRIDGSLDVVPIDAQGRITVLGHPYGPTNWDH